MLVFLVNIIYMGLLISLNIISAYLIISVNLAIFEYATNMLETTEKFEMGVIAFIQIWSLGSFSLGLWFLVAFIVTVILTSIKDIVLN